MPRKKKKVEVEEVPPPQLPVQEPTVLMKMHDVLGLVHHEHPGMFCEVRLTGVQKDIFFVRDEATGEEMEMSRATGCRRKVDDWAWRLGEEDLGLLNRTWTYG